MKGVVQVFDYSKLLDIMYHKRHTRKSLAPYLGLSPQGLGHYFTEGKPFPMDYVATIAWVLDIPDNEVLEIFSNRKKGGKT